MLYVEKSGGSHVKEVTAQEELEILVEIGNNSCGG